MAASTETLARRLRGAANDYERRLLKAFRGDRDMERSARKDRADLEEIARWLDEGQLAYAYGSASWLDTAVRDEIPTSVWRAMTRAHEAAEAAKARPRRRGGLAGGIA